MVKLASLLWLSILIGLVQASELIDAVKAGQMQKLKGLLRSEDVDERDEAGNTALIWAARKNSTEAIKIILTKHPNVDIQSKDGWTALMCAAQYGSTEAVDAILAEHPNLDLQEIDGWTALMVATDHGSTAGVKAILAKHPNVDIQTKDGWTALMIAVHCRSTELVKTILAENPNVDLEDKDGHTALIVASYRGSVEAVKAILAKHPNVDHQTFTGGTALANAAHEGFPDVLWELLAANASIDLPDFAGRTPLFSAAMTGASGSVALLLERGARPDVVARNGQTALDAAKRYHPSFGSIQNIWPPLDEGVGRKTVQLLKGKTPTGWELLHLRASSPRLWKLMGVALLGGVLIGIAWHCFSGRWLSNTEQGIPTGVRRVALRALARFPLWHQALRAVEVIANVLFPLGVAMLWIRWKLFLLFYLFAYLVPRACELSARAVHHPILLLCGLKRGKGFCDARTPRIFATAFFLALSWMMPAECEKMIRYYIYEGPAPKPGPLIDLMVLGTTFFSPMLNRAASQFACPAFNAMPYWISQIYLIFLFFIWLTSLVWMLLTLAEMLGFIVRDESLDAETEDVVHELEAKLLQTSTAEEVNQTFVEVSSHVRFSAEAEKDWVWFPPGGINFRVFMAVLDGLIFDFVSIFNLIRAGEFYFGAALAFITMTSCTSEMLAWRHHPSLWEETSKSLKKGIITEPVMKLLELENAFEAPFALALNCYSWSFAVQDWFSLIFPILTLSLGVYTLSGTIYWFEDLDLHLTKPEAEAYSPMLTDESSDEVSSKPGP